MEVRSLKRHQLVGPSTSAQAETAKKSDCHSAPLPQSSLTRKETRVTSGQELCPSLFLSLSLSEAPVAIAFVPAALSNTSRPGSWIIYSLKKKKIFIFLYFTP